MFCVDRRRVHADAVAVLLWICTANCTADRAAEAVTKNLCSHDESSHASVARIEPSPGTGNRKISFRRMGLSGELWPHFDLSLAIYSVLRCSSVYAEYLA
jgi:hypothetical protein